MKKEKLPSLIPQVGLYLFAIGLPLSFVPAEFGLGLAMLGWLLEGIFNKRWQFQYHPILIALGVYLAWNLVSILISPVPLHGVWALADNEWPLFIMLMLFWTVPDTTTLKRLFTAFCITATVAMAYGILQTFTGWDLVKHREMAPIGVYYRAIGFNGFYLTFGGFAMTVFFLSLSVWAEYKERLRWFFGILALLSFAAIIGTFARSLWLSLLIAVPVFGFIRSKKIGTILSLLFFVLVGGALLFSPTIRSRAVSIFDFHANETRLNLWQTSWKMIQARPVTGFGEDNFTLYFDQYKVPGYYDVACHPHNDYLNVLVSAGVPGLIAFLALWFFSIQAGYRAWRRSTDPFARGLAFGGTLTIIGFLVGSFFQTYYVTFANCFDWWFATGFVFAVYHLSSKDDSKEHPNLA
jgi:putative inorganic carbon (HCO3(-)) transporter